MDSNRYRIFPTRSRHSFRGLLTTLFALIKSEELGEKESAAVPPRSTRSTCGDQSLRSVRSDPTHIPSPKAPRLPAHLTSGNRLASRHPPADLLAVPGCSQTIPPNHTETTSNAPTNTLSPDVPPPASSAFEHPLRSCTRTHYARALLDAAAYSLRALQTM